MSIIPQALIAIVLIALIGVGAIFIGTNAPREQEKVHPAIVCTVSTTPIDCVGN